MIGQRRRAVYFIAFLVGIVFVYTVVYDWGMSAFEDRPRDLLHSLGIVIETFTTTGFGADAPWRSSQMQALVILMQFTGVFIIFLTLPLFVAPWVERRLSTTVPRAAGDLERHVVLCEFSKRGESLIDELESWEQGYVIVEPDRDRAAELIERGLSVVHGEPESTAALERANIGSAAAVLADATDERNASIALSVREVSDDVRLLAFAEEPDMADYLRLAGADDVFSPKTLLGGSLANEVTTAVSMDLGETVEIGADFEVVELPVQSGCSIDGRRLAESGIRERTGVNVIGLWERGEFTTAPGPDDRLSDDTILLVAGSESQLASLKRLTLSEERRRARGSVVVAGYGEVGSTVAGAIAASEMQGVVVDLVDRPGVDVVGDATRPQTLIEAGIETADALILALGDDTAILLATLVARELAPDVRIVARAAEAESLGKMYRAGADYVLALSTVSGRMLASTILEEEVVTPEKQIEIVRTAAPALVGESLASADVRNRTGATVIAIERDGRVLTEIEPSVVIEAGDTVIVAGTDEAINAFNQLAQ